MDIVSLTVAVNYHGELAATCSHLVKQCDASYVITSPDDFETERIAVDAGATVVSYHGFHDRGAKFNKSGAIRTAQIAARSRHPGAWILITDADILVPANLREIILSQSLNRATLYGMKRLDYNTPEDFAAGRVSLEYPHDFAGYFQLYRREMLYAAWSDTAGKCDWRFKRLFRQRVLLPGVCHHLGFKSKNWEGRTTPEWYDLRRTL
jgi:hypothetical protein